jgi:CubicO group peptidase (beta-lactamase class C family)
MKLLAAFALLFFAAATAVADPAIDQLFRDYDRSDAPGAAVIVIKDGTIVHESGYGMADLEGGAKATNLTNFRLASLTKEFTAMAVMMLVEEGKLSYEEALTDVFPDFPAFAHGIKIRHLLNHQAGFQDYEDLIPSGQTTPVHDEDVLALLRGTDHLQFTPGSRYQYSNGGYCVLAQVVQKVSGQTFASFLHDRIFGPLGMDNTLAYEAGISTVSNRAYGYTQDGNGFDRTDQSVTSSTLGDGGIYTSVHDLYKWDQALYTERLVKKATLDRAFTPGTLNDGSTTEYGFGWMLDTYEGMRRIHHTGSTIGFRTVIRRFPEKGFTVVVLMNRAADGAPEDLADQVVQMYLKN